MDDIRSMLQEMRAEHRLDHAELKSAIADLTRQTAQDRTAAAVHDAVCQADRVEMRRDIESNRAKIWKIVVAVLGGGAAAGGTASYLLETIFR